MKCLSPFAWALCLLLALGVLFAATGNSDAGELYSVGVMDVGEKLTEDIEEDFSEELFSFDILCAATHFTRNSGSCSFFISLYSPDRTSLFCPFGWLLPIRI